MPATIVSGSPTPRVGVLFPGDARDPTVWSGTPAGIVGALEECGVDVVVLRAGLPTLVDEAATHVLALPYIHRTSGRHPLRRARVAKKIGKYHSPAALRLRSLAARRVLSRAGRLDGILQIGTGYAVRTDPPVVTFEDMTVAQGVDAGYAHLRALSRRALAWRLTRQRDAYERASACCAATHWAGDSLVRDYGVPSGKVHIVGIGRNHSVTVAPRSWERPRFLFVGMDWDRKNGAAVLQAFARLRETIPEASLDVVGRHPMIDLPGVTAHGALRLDVTQERVRLERLFQTATCFVLPSLHEPVGIVYAEAAAAGIPSIATTAGGAAEVIGQTGRIVDPTDDNALLQAMKDLAEPQTAARLGGLATERAELFTWRAVAERLLRAFAFSELGDRPLADFL